MTVYAVLVNGELLPNYFNTYNDALDEVKRLYTEWDDRFEEHGNFN